MMELLFLLLLGDRFDYARFMQPQFSTFSFVIDLSQGLIHVLDCHRGCLLRTLKGHGDGVHDVRIHPIYPEIIVTASKDESVRYLLFPYMKN
jgi:WD40 repeat protein